MQEEGGALEGSLALSTTHVIGSSKAETAAEATLHLSQAVRSFCQLVASDAAQGSHADAAAPGPSPGERSKARAIEALQTRVAVVTAQWVSDSLAQRQRLPEHRFHDSAAAEAFNEAIATGLRVAASRSQPSAQLQHPATTSTSPEPAKAAAAATVPSTPATPRQHTDASEEAGRAAPSLPQVTDTATALQASSNAGVARTGADGLAAAAQLPAVSAEQIRASGAAAPGTGSHLQDAGGHVLQDWQPPGWTSACWGKGGLWLEPYTAADVQDTLAQLYRHYHRLDLQGGRHDRPVSASPQKTAAMPPQHQDSPGGASASPLSAETSPTHMPHSPDAPVQEQRAQCEHAACQRAPVCIVAELEETTKQYVRNRGQDTFRLFATRKAIARLLEAPGPLAHDEDVDALQLGSKSTEKVKDILREGFLERNVRFNDDAAARAYALFNSVWGVGPTLAQQWVEAGHRSLEAVLSDAVAVAQLSRQARAGLVHHVDLAQRIPRLVRLLGFGDHCDLIETVV